MVTVLGPFHEPTHASLRSNFQSVCQARSYSHYSCTANRTVSIYLVHCLTKPLQTRLLLSCSEMAVASDKRFSQPFWMLRKCQIVCFQGVITLWDALMNRRHRLAQLVGHGVAGAMVTPSCDTSHDLRFLNLAACCQHKDISFPFFSFLYLYVHIHPPLSLLSYLMFTTTCLFNT